VAVDVDGDGLLDVLAVSFLPKEFMRHAIPEKHPDSIILLHQTAPGKFTRYALETSKNNHVTCAAGDLDGDGKIHLVTGDCFVYPLVGNPIPALSVWRNLGPTKSTPTPAP
jgi:hypothetical protein